MKTEIHFLQELEDDLLDAVGREAHWTEERPSSEARRPPVRLHRATGGRPRRRVIALLAAALLALAGIVGYFATRDGAPMKAELKMAAPSVRHVEESLRFGPAPRAPAPQTAPTLGASGGAGAGSSTGPRAIDPLQGIAPSVNGSVLIGPQIVKTARLGVVVAKGHFDGAFATASRVAARYGGFVETSSSSGRPAKAGSLQIRVPAADFDRALADLRALGRVDGQSIEGQDVTAEYVDLQARIRTWEAQETALLRLMSKAVTVGDTLRVQGELQHVQLTIEQLKGQLRVLNDQTAKATIAVSIREAGAPVVTQQEVQNPSLSTGWKRAIAGFYGVLVAVVVGLGYLVPVMLLGLIAWIVIRRTRRRAAA